MQTKRCVVVLMILMTWMVGQAQAQSRPNTRPAGVVNINTASMDQLELLPGIGPGRASRIVSFRSLKPFRRVVELSRVKGIGRKTVRRLKVYLTVEGPTTLSRRPPKTP
ncbi:MAG: ComEA family DNA-binding protein [Myxococcota bacterium]